MRNDFDIIGNLGKVHPLNDKTVKADIAVNHPYKDKKTGEWQKRTDWISITCFDELANRIRSYSIGSLITAQGRVKNTQYQKDDEKVYAINLVTSKLSLLQKKEREQDSRVVHSSTHSSQATSTE